MSPTMERFPGEILTYAQILPNLFIGSHPRTIADIECLRREAGITAVLNIHTDDDMRAVNLNFPPLEAHYQTCTVSCAVPPWSRNSSSFVRSFAPPSKPSMSSSPRATSSI